MIMIIIFCALKFFEIKKKKIKEAQIKINYGLHIVLFVANVVFISQEISN
jgi:hypothetical protein